MDRAGVECGCGWEARRMGLGLGAGRGRGGSRLYGEPGRSRGGQEGRGPFLGRRPACLLAGRAVPACGPRVRPKHGLHPVPCQPGPIDLRAGPG